MKSTGNGEANSRRDNDTVTGDAGKSKPDRWNERVSRISCSLRSSARKLVTFSPPTCSSSSLSLSPSHSVEEEDEEISGKSDHNGDQEDGASIINTNTVASTDETLGSDSQQPAGYVALTIDDVPCRFNDRNLSRLPEILDLFAKYNAKATFMVISSFLSSCHEPDMIRLLREGHELANHGVRDEPMDKLSTSVDVFLEALDECNHKIEDLQQKANRSSDSNASPASIADATADATVPVGVKWFRAPQAKYTSIMEEGLARRNMFNVMCDAYAACPIIEDGPWIAKSLGKQIEDGSIALIHMPEKCGFREYCFEAIELLLEDLCVRKNFQLVTVSELQRISEARQSK
eukprot:jgi/Psemu1/262688/estExt_Genewise1Plus.C_8220021